MGTFNDIFEEVKESLGNRDDIDTRITRWINHAYFELLQSPRFSFHEIETSDSSNIIAPSTIQYPLPSDCWLVLDARVQGLTDGWKLRKTHWHFQDKLYYAVASTGKPQRYFLFGTNIVLDRWPATTYTDTAHYITIRYRKHPTALTIDSSTIIGDQWDEVIESLAITKGAERLEMPERAAMHRQIVEQLLSVRTDIFALEDMDAEIGIAPRMD